MKPMTKDQMPLILTVMTLEEFEEYQSLVETKIYHTILTKEEEARILVLSGRLIDVLRPK